MLAQAADMALRVGPTRDWKHGPFHILELLELELVEGIFVREFTTLCLARDREREVQRLYLGSGLRRALMSNVG